MATRAPNRLRPEQIEINVDRFWSLADYISWYNGADPLIVTDLDHWAEQGITTARGLYDYLGGAHERNVEKSERS